MAADAGEIQGMKSEATSNVPFLGEFQNALLARQSRNQREDGSDGSNGSDLQAFGRVAAAMVCMVVLALAPLAWAQMARPGVVKGFKLPEFYEPVPGKIPANRLKTLIMGAEAEPLSRDLVAVKGMRLETYQVDRHTNVIATAPQCWVDLERRHVWSAGRLELETGDGRLSMSGSNGFYCQMTNFSMVISNHVRTVIHHAMFGSTNL